MYIPIWIIIAIAIVAYFIYRSKKTNTVKNTIKELADTPDDIEENVSFTKGRIFNLEHFDSPHFIDVQDAFDTMEINYLRLKQRFFHNKEKVLEIAKDWERYANCLQELKYSRIMYDLDWSDDSGDNFTESSKQPAIAKEEIEKKFKALLDKDWQEIPPDYFKRRETMKKPENKKDSAVYELGEDWKWYYRDSANLYKLEEKRRKEKEQEGLKEDNK
jgi:hypothetical protein